MFHSFFALSLSFFFCDDRIGLERLRGAQRLHGTLVSSRLDKEPEGGTVRRAAREKRSKIRKKERDLLYVTQTPNTEQPLNLFICSQDDRTLQDLRWGNENNDMDAAKGGDRMSLSAVSSYSFPQVIEPSCSLKTVLASNTCSILFSIQMLFAYRSKSPFLDIKKMSYAKIKFGIFSLRPYMFLPAVRNLLFDFPPLSLRLRLWLLLRLFCLSHVDLRRTVLLCSLRISSIFEQPPELIVSHSGRQ